MFSMYPGNLQICLYQYPYPSHRPNKILVFGTTFLSGECHVVGYLYLYWFTPPFEPYVESVPGSTVWRLRLKRQDCWIEVIGHGPNPPLFGLLPLSDDRPPASLAVTHYREAMCVVAWSDSPNEASIGTLSRGRWIVTLAWFLDFVGGHVMM
jgi:hypothetical protein